MTIWSEDRIRKAEHELESWHGEKHRDCMAIRGVGIDCANLVHEALIAAEIVTRVELGRYNTKRGLFNKSDHLQEVFLRSTHSSIVQADRTQAQDGDIVIFKTVQASAHCGVFIHDRVWHALSRRCVTVSPWQHWKHKAESLVRIFATGWREQPAAVINQKNLKN